MYRKLAFAALGFILPLSFSIQPTIAYTVLEKVAKTGVLTVGTSKDAFPFAYQNNKGQLIGYSVDMVKLIEKQLEQELKGCDLYLMLNSCDPIVEGLSRDSLKDF